jgi:hypothetical protein
MAGVAYREAAAELRAWPDLRVAMAGLESIALAPGMQRSPDIAMAVVGQLEDSLPGVIDVDEERTHHGFPLVSHSEEASLLHALDQ